MENVARTIYEVEGRLWGQSHLYGIAGKLFKRVACNSFLSLCVSIFILCTNPSSHTALNCSSKETLEAQCQAYRVEAPTQIDLLKSNEVGLGRWSPHSPKHRGLFGQNILARSFTFLLYSPRCSPNVLTKRTHAVVSFFLLEQTIKENQSNPI